LDDDTNADRTPALEAWLTLAGQLSTKPEPPAMPVTWAELPPTAAPHPSDGASLERFADWLTLAELLIDYDPGLLADLGFPGHTERFCEHFLKVLEPDPGRIAPADIGQAVRALSRLRRVIPSLADPADAIRFRLSRDEFRSVPSSRGDPQPEPIPQTGHLDVQRVLADL
jgi:hypothetical protein